MATCSLKYNVRPFTEYTNNDFSNYSQENIDIYSTKEPQEAFHHRITFCLDIHNQSVKVRSALIRELRYTTRSP